MACSEGIEALTRSSISVELAWLRVAVLTLDERLAEALMLLVGNLSDIKVNRLIAVVAVVGLFIVVILIVAPMVPLRMKLLVEIDDFLEIFVLLLLRGRKANANLHAGATLRRARTPLAELADRAEFLLLVGKKNIFKFRRKQSTPCALQKSLRFVTAACR